MMYKAAFFRPYQNVFYMMLHPITFCLWVSTAANVNEDIRFDQTFPHASNFAYSYTSSATGFVLLIRNEIKEDSYDISKPNKQINIFTLT